MLMNDDIKQAVLLLKENGYTVSPPSDSDELFEQFWTLYGKKIDRKKSLQKWRKLSLKDKRAAIAYLPKYIEATPDIQYRRNPTTFLNNRTWENEIIGSHKPKVEHTDYGSLIQQSVVDNETKLHEKRQRIYRIIEAVKENPKSLMRQTLINMYNNGILKDMNIEWTP